MRHSQTVGLERSPLPPPNVYLGWTADGLYMGMEVFDNDIQGAPAKGWWWTRDNVEFWIFHAAGDGRSARLRRKLPPVLLCPAGPGDEQRCGGVCRAMAPAWRMPSRIISFRIRRSGIRPGCWRIAMSWRCSSRPRCCTASTRPLSRRWPSTFMCANYQHAIDYFWSAPKEVMTQLRPRTWVHAASGTAGGGEAGGNGCGDGERRIADRLVVASTVAQLVARACSPYQRRSLTSDFWLSVLSTFIRGFIRAVAENFIEGGA